MEGLIITPTNEQAQASLRVCQWLSNTYRNIELFRFNSETGDVYIFAGDELQVIIPPNGLWRFINETEF